MRFPFLLPRLGLSRPNSACLLVFPVQAAGKAQDYLAIDTFPGNFKKWNGSTLKYVKNQTILMACYHPGSHHRHLLPALPRHPPSWSLCLSPPPRHGGVLRHSVVSHARQAPLSMELFRQEHWSGLLFPSQRLFFSGSWVSSNHLRAPISHRDSKALTVGGPVSPAPSPHVTSFPLFSLMLCSSLLLLKHESTASHRAFTLTVSSFWDVFLHVSPWPTALYCLQVFGQLSPFMVAFLESSPPAQSISLTLLFFVFLFFKEFST